MRYLEVFNWPPIFNMTNNKLFSVLILVVILSLILIIPFIVFGENMEGLVSGLLENNSAGRPFLFAVIIVLLLASDVLLPVASSILSSGSGYFDRWDDAGMCMRILSGSLWLLYGGG